MLASPPRRPFQVTAHIFNWRQVYSLSEKRYPLSIVGIYVPRVEEKQMSFGPYQVLEGGKE